MTSAVAARRPLEVARHAPGGAAVLCSGAVLVASLYGGGVSTAVTAALLAAGAGTAALLAAQGALRPPSAFAVSLFALAAWTLLRSGDALGATPTPLAVLLYAAIAWLAEQADGRDLLRTLRWTILGIATLALAGAATHLAPVAEPGSHRLSWPVTYANGLGVLLVVGVLLWARSRSAVGTLVCATAAVLTFSRAALLGLVVAAAWAAARRLSGRQRLVAGVAVLCAIAVAAVPLGRRVAADAPDSRSASRLVSLSGHDRARLWRAAVDESRERPVAGAGLGALTREGVGNPHSLELQLLAELGVVGLVLAAVAAVAAVRRSRSSIGLLCGLAWLVAASVDWIWLLPAATLPAVVVVAACRPGGGLRSMP